MNRLNASLDYKEWKKRTFTNCGTEFKTHAVIQCFDTSLFTIHMHLWGVNTALIWCETNKKLNTLQAQNPHFPVELCNRIQLITSTVLLCGKTNLENHVNWWNLCSCKCKPNILKGHILLVPKIWPSWLKTENSYANVDFYFTSR